MSDLAGNPEDRFSRVEAHFMKYKHFCHSDEIKANSLKHLNAVLGT